MADLTDRLRGLLGIELAELRGTRVAGELPVLAAVVNRLIAGRLARSHGLVTAARVQPRPDNVIDVEVTPSARFVPSVTVQVRIERQPVFPGSPQLVLRWGIPAAGPLARLAAPFIANLKSLPPGVRIDADVVVIDLRDILASQGHAELIQYVRSLRLDTRPEGFVVTFELGIG